LDCFVTNIPHNNVIQIFCRNNNPFYHSCTGGESKKLIPVFRETFCFTKALRLFLTVRNNQERIYVFTMRRIFAVFESIIFYMERGGGTESAFCLLLGLENSII
jgi:hypothetical protein